MADLLTQLAQAQSDLKILNDQLASKKAEIANMYLNYTSCVNFANGNAGALDNCWANKPPYYKSQYEDLQAQGGVIQSNINAKQAEIASIQTSINNDPTALAAQKAAANKKTITIVVVIVVAVIVLIGGFLYGKKQGLI